MYLKKVSPSSNLESDCRNPCLAPEISNGNSSYVCTREKTRQRKEEENGEEKREEVGLGSWKGGEERGDGAATRWGERRVKRERERDSYVKNGKNGLGLGF